ncbi:leucine-rich repeat receptor-like serine/threonine-protein kinase At2g14510 [Triticum aestivum]|uniref:leucine-rich repeat receptor-like serine/threonine-protein kinase At2g14510 n=1 Tax=Triticum aestivum TaxID=4565 RepID=UPI001D01D868|nr:leucine-rich repeat receptor-like serine/threonine-protein kinase At2g14510 [Triticum aestivum]
MATSFSCSASTKLTWIFALLLILATMIQVRAQPPTAEINKLVAMHAMHATIIDLVCILYSKHMKLIHTHRISGFVNIDCGWTNSSAYIDNATRIVYRFDGESVEGGLSHEISEELMAGAANEQQKTLRSFPDGSRNCYTLTSIVGKKYLLRALFTYGNYDGLNKTMDGSPFLFGLHIGVNFWESVNLTNTDPSDTVWKEVITVAPSNAVSVCLINFGSGTPFISALELRPLEDTMYPFVNTSVSISNFQRFRFGNVTDPITRYPTDNYDRFWERWPDTSYPWINLNTNNKVESLDNVFNVPADILQKASTIDTNYSHMSVIVATGRNQDGKSLQLLPIFHFADINESNLSRRFDIYNAEGLLFPDFSPLRFQMVSKYKSGEFLHADAFFNLSKTPSSSLPPLINALEVYSLIRMDNLTTDSDDANYIKEVKTHYSLAQRNWNGDPCSPREYSWEGLTCDYSKSNQNPRIVTVNLSTSRLRGGFAISFMNMTSLENLDLSHNNLTGAIPDYQLQSLKFLDLSNNKLDGAIPDSILQRFQAGSLDLRLEGNPVCSNVKDTYCSKKKNTTSTVLIAVIVPVVLVSLLVVMGILWKLYREGKSGDDEDSAMYEEETPLHIDIRRFTYAELKHITNDFQSIVGKGGFGTVYHGTLENDDEVAVKVLMETSIAESTDFLPEVQTLSKVHHKNLVTLQGYCQNKKCLALVYDFMPRGNLQQLLRGGDYSLNWEQRLHIALDAAQGLEYLHELCTPSIVHRDVKTPNILLDKNLVGIISDFGLSRAFNDAHTHISTAAAAGTPGYIDPEYHASYQITVKTDVYSFGIVLLEIITGQPPLLMDPQTVHLPNWVRRKIAMGSIHDVVDKRLMDQYDASSLQSVVDLAMNCVENAAVDRPTMTVVATRLKGLLPAVSSEKQSVSATPRRTYSMDSEIPRQFQMMISGASNEGSSFQSGYTNGMSQMSLLSGR